MNWIKNWFSNMIPLDHPVTIDNIEYRTVENIFQAYKVEKVDETTYLAIATRHCPLFKIF